MYPAQLKAKLKLIMQVYGAILSSQQLRAHSTCNHLIYVVDFLSRTSQSVSVLSRLISSTFRFLLCDNYTLTNAPKNCRRNPNSSLNLCILILALFYRTNVVMNYTEVEGKVREATNDDPWGPTGPLMQELAHSTFTYEHFPEVMSMLWRRMLQDNKTNWRRTYKV